MRKIVFLQHKCSRSNQDRVLEGERIFKAVGRKSPKQAASDVGQRFSEPLRGEALRVLRSI